MTTAAAIGLLASLPGILLLLLATRHGLALDGDAASYLDLARSIRRGDGPTVASFGATPPVASAHFPPLYPLLLAAAGPSRLAHAALLAMTGVLAAVIVAASVKGAKPWQFVLAAGLVTLHTDVLRLFAGVASEALFVPLTMSAVAATVAKRPWLAAAAVAAAMPTRHVGLALLVLPLLAAGQARPRTAWIAAVLSTVPYAAWRAWVALGDGPDDRVLRWHPPSWHEWLEVVASFGRWPLPVDAGAWWPFVGLGVIVATTTGWVAVASARSDWRTTARRARAEGERASWRSLAARHRPWLVLPAYAGVVLIARTLLDASVPLGGRMWAPLIGVVVPMLVARMPTAAGGTNPIAHAFNGMILAVLRFVGFALLTVVAVVSLHLAVSRFQDGHGYASPAWRASPTVAHVAKLPPGDLIVSNAADAIGVLLRRPAMLPPLSRFPTAGRPNTRRYDQLADLRGQGVTVVWFDAIDRDYLVTLDEVRRYLDVEEVARFDDGVVLRERVSQAR